MIRTRLRERGAAALEFAGVAPLVILAALIALQIGVVGWTVVATGQAARDAARSAALGHDARTAAEASLPGSLEVEDLTGGHLGDGHHYTVTVEIPTIGPFSLGSVSRSAAMPDIR